jgi:hypothetical protein
MAVGQVMIRTHAATRDALRELAEAENTSLIEMLDRLVRRAHEERVLGAVVATLGGHVHAIAAETDSLDALASDGLDPREDFSEW